MVFQTKAQESGTKPVFGAYPIIANYFFGSPYAFTAPTQTSTSTTSGSSGFQIYPQASGPLQPFPISSPQNFYPNQWSRFPGRSAFSEADADKNADEPKL